jgi:predicted CxxxxCH...CXXCH cytochrome family protein
MMSRVESSRSTQRRHTSRSSPALALSLCAFVVLLASTACNESSHWGEKTAVTPRPGVHSMPLSSGANCSNTSVHTTHVNMFACATCHPCGAFGFDTPYTFPGGTTTAGGTLTRGTPTTCTVACHFPKGSPSHEISWNEPTPLSCLSCHASSSLPSSHSVFPPTSTREECQGCHRITQHMEGTVAIQGHDAAWMDTTGPGFHAFAANERGLSNCAFCHGADLSGGAARVSCAQCHGSTWRSNCTMCHGGTDNLTGAPPRTTWGNSTDPLAVGAHTIHVATSTTSNGFACTVCHVKPADALASGHANGLTELTFGGLATSRGAAPAWDGTAATCASTYCHGTIPSGLNPSPVWTADVLGTNLCRACHGTPPGSGAHWIHTSFSCARCHNHVVSTGLAIINKTLHVNGVNDVRLNVTGVYVPSTETEPATCTSVSCHLSTYGDETLGW